MLITAGSIARVVAALPLLAIAENLEAQPHDPGMAAMGAKVAGQNYENAVVCRAPADLLNAYKTSRHAMFAAAGDQFEAAFAAGRATGAANWKDLVTREGETEARSSYCERGHIVATTRAALANK